MNENEAKDMIDRMKTGWFSKWRPDPDVESMWFEWLTRVPSAEDAQRAIVQHRADGGSVFEPKLGKCKEILATLTASVSAGGERKQTPLVDTLRRHLNLGGHVSDCEVWIRYYRAVFVNKARARESEVRPIWHQCYHQLASMGVPGMDSDGWEQSTAGRCAWLSVADEHTFGFELAGAVNICEQHRVKQEDACPAA
jgi:hypothetical protein